jgi:putative cell wall-binding protein
MLKSIVRPFAVVLAFASLVGASVGVGIGFSPAGAVASMSFVSVPTGEIAGQVFSSFTPEVNVADESSTFSVTFSITSGTGTPGAVLTCAGTGTNGDTFAFTAQTSPVAANGCSINEDGTGYTLTASEAPQGGTAVSSPGFNVTGGATQLQFTAAPTSTPAGQILSGSLSVELEDMHGNIVNTGTQSTDTISIQIASGPPGATLTCAPRPASGGSVGFFSCTINKVGLYTLEATDLTNPFISPAFSSPLFAAIPITPGPETQLAFTTSPALNSTVPLGPGTFPIVVAVEDAFGNVETGDSTDAITVAFAPGGNPGAATLTCPDANVLTVTAGVANFSAPGCAISATGTGYQLEATDTNTNTPAFTQFFNVNTVVIPPNVTTLPASPVSSTGATLNGSLNPGGAVQSCSYLYGTNPSLIGALSTGAINSFPLSIPVAVTIPVGSLLPNTTYYFQLVCSDGSGAILSFTTPFTGFVTTTVATPVSTTTATLNGTVNPGGVVVSCSYLYSTASNLAGALSTGTVFTSASVTPVSVPFPVAGLQSGTTYYYELVCSNGTGGILSFRTAASGTPPLITIFGPDAIGTSIATSQYELPTPGSAPVVVLARSDFFADALTGGPLAAFFGGPLLITPGTPLSLGLDPRVLAEIQRVLVPGGTVYILGGTQALSPWIDLQLANLGYVTHRVAGANQNGTAVAVAGVLGNPSTIFEATGLSFQDALSAVPAAILTHGAILLTNGATQSPETAAYLAAFPGDTRYAIGGALAAGGADPTATDIAGSDLYGTSAAVAQTFFGSGVHAFAIATGVSYQDALGGGVFITTGGRVGPMLLVAPNVPLPPSIAAYLATLGPSTQGYAFGGVLAISVAVLGAVQAAIG